MKRKIMTSLVALALITTQTGCIFGALTFPFGLPLIVLGSAMMVSDDGDGGWVVAGVLLDRDNPGHVDALNQLPLSKKIAMQQGVTLQDIQNYNDNLNHIQTVAQQMRQDIMQVMKQQTRGGEPAVVMNKKDFQQLAQDYGFRSGEQMMQAMKQSQLSKQDLRQFAQSRAVQLDPAQARIFLQTGFNIKIER